MESESRLQSLQIGTKVRNKETEKIGVVINDTYRCCGENELLVVYENDVYALGTDISNLENLGPENAQADPEKCGANQNGKCCLFLACDPTGYSCTRFTTRRDGVILSANGKTLKRVPDKMYPYCQLS